MLPVAWSAGCAPACGVCLADARGRGVRAAQALDLHDLVRVDPPLGQQLEQLDVLIRRKKHLEVAGGAPGGAALLMGGVSVEELCLDFTLPGYPEYELKPGGGECSVTLGNLEEYVRLLLRASLADGVAPQVDAFRAGFNQVRTPCSRCTLAPPSRGPPSRLHCLRSVPLPERGQLWCARCRMRD